MARDLASTRVLTEVQAQVVEGVMVGETNRLIARRLGMALGTVGTHLVRTFAVLGIHARSELWHSLVPRDLLTRMQGRGELAQVVAGSLWYVEEARKLMAELGPDHRMELRRRAAGVAALTSDEPLGDHHHGVFSLRTWLLASMGEDTPYTEWLLDITDALICHLCSSAGLRLADGDEARPLAQVDALHGNAASFRRIDPPVGAAGSG
ncbi:MAG TPA: LuxR C-terminal-related transcriptional regulator [Candidatus Dormibacteraeota bacterium]|jgi:DNA-binding CsgD family transcriptional regulator|nr:LuxR C-terminal-related transcriptional regulator [Candidatus Dormibacteraeota bacterium]